MKFGALAQKSIYEISLKDLTNWRYKRLKEVDPSTIHRKKGLYSSFLHMQKLNCF